MIEKWLVSENGRAYKALAIYIKKFNIVILLKYFFFFFTLNKFLKGYKRLTANLYKMNLKSI